MSTELTGYIDFAQITVYAFWIFFAGLLLYLRREDRREGYPLEVERANYKRQDPWFWIPEPKTFELPHGGTVMKPDFENDERPIAAAPIAAWDGAPLVPTGNPLIDGVGPAAWAERADRPDLTMEGEARIVPLRVAKDFSIAGADIDPRGLRVIALNDKTVGRITDVWVDRSEVMIRYLEVELAGEETAAANDDSAAAGRHVLIPMNLARVSKPTDPRDRPWIKVASIMSYQFDDVPGLKNPDQVTLLEEEKIMAYFTGGHLYAYPARTEPLM